MNIASATLEGRKPIPLWASAVAVAVVVFVAGLTGFIARGLMVKAASSDADPKIARLRDASTADPDDTRKLLDLGFALQQDGRDRDALEVYDQVLERSPSDAAANYYSGEIYRRLGESAKAEEAFWNVLEVESDHVLAAKALGEMYAERKQYRSMLAALRPAVDKRPEMADLQYQMGYAYEHLGRLEWAEARYELAVKYAPGMIDAHEALRRVRAAK